jgi:hypothetical protein
MVAPLTTIAIGMSAHRDYAILRSPNRLA